MFAEGYIGIAGIIGVGKSTLTTRLAEALGFDPILEEVDGNKIAVTGGWDAVVGANVQ